MDTKGHRCSLPGTLRHGESDTHLPPILPGTSLTGRLLRHIRALLLVSPRHPETRNYYRSRTEIRAENARLVRELPPFIIHPFSSLRRCWEMMIYFVLTVHLVTLAFAFAFAPHLSREVLNRLQLFDTVLCALLGMEFALNLVTGYVHQGEVVLDPRRIVRYRLRCWNLANRMLLFVPYVLLLDELVRAFYQDSVLAYLCLVVYLYLLCVWRFRNVRWYFATVARSLFRLSVKQIRFLEPIMDTLYVLHWTACVLYVLPLLSMPLIGEGQFESHFLVDVLWAQDQARNDHLYPIQHRSRLPPVADYRAYFRQRHSASPSTELTQFVEARLTDVEHRVSVTYRYLRATMITLKVSLQGGHSLSLTDYFMHEWLYSLLLLGGWIWFTYVLLLLIRTLVTADASRTRYDEILNEADAFCRERRLRPAMREKMSRQIACRFRLRYFDEAPIRAHASDHLYRSFLTEVVCKAFLARAELFRELPTYLMVEIADLMQFELYQEQDRIVIAGEAAQAMYFLAMGTAAVYTAEDVEIGHLVDGANFGAVALFRTDILHPVTVVSLEVCEVYRLVWGNFQQLFKPHGFLLAPMVKQAEKRILERVLLEEEHPEERYFDPFFY
ncbi:uncharacterized protein LOC128726954 [Anopheles nili]|uniref:uncharacterized protein LOC128726954 n=1 Tax=Anopheles nili TaxID=185578 RepID=UPI00237BE765|nr:uncharacterized protein LOC128726954 [Anopheles nili]